MKKYFLLLLFTAISYAQTNGVTKLKITANPEKTAATRVVVQDAATGEVGYVNKTTIVTLDATNTTTGKIQLSGDLGGTATLPTVPGLATKENTIAPGTTSQYYRGDKTWQTLDKTAVGLGNVDNTSDLSKPISNATQTALDGKQATLVSGTNIKTVESQSLLGSGNVDLTKTDVGLSNVDNTSDVNKPVSSATQTALNAKQNTSEKNQVNGYAGLGSDGKLISSQLPSITITDTFVVGSQSAMLSLVAETGDVAVRTDLSKSYILKGTNPSLLGDWQELLSPVDGVTSVFGRVGSVTAQNGDYTTAQVTETTNKKYQTDAQALYNDATSSIQTQLNAKATDSNTVHKTGDETIAGIKTFSSLANFSASGIKINTNGWVTPNQVYGKTGNFFVNYSGTGNTIIGNPTGNVGIGTTSPNYSSAGRTTVDINGTSQSMLALSTAGVGKGFLFHTGTDLLLSNEINGAIKFNTNGSQKIVVETGGNVGIGIASPGQKLVVDGGSTDFTPIFAKSSLLSGGKYFSSLLAGYQTDVSKSAQFGYAYNTSNIADSFAHITTFGALEGSQFAIKPNGNVGIGTVNPDGKLNVYTGASVTNSTAFNAGDGSNSIKYIPYTSAGAYNDLSVVGGGLLLGNINSKLTIGTWNGTGIQFGPTNTLINGNVGISTSAPTSKLQVSKGSQSNTVSIANSSSFLYGTDVGLAIGQDNGAGAYGTWVQSMRTDNTSFGLSLNPNGGDVTVGGLTPTGYKFTVKGGQYGTLIQGGDLGTGSEIVKFSKADTSLAMFIRGDGNVGIANASPSEKLTIGGNVLAAGFFQSSDLRLKDIISRDGDVIKYKWKDKRDDKIHIGYVAQEVQKENPEQVNTDEKGMLSVNYIEILVEKIRKLEKEIELLKSK